jgi:hypothetical protein
MDNKSIVDRFQVGRVPFLGIPQAVYKEGVSETFTFRKIWQ